MDGYSTMLTFMVENHYDIHNDDDVKDAFVDATKDVAHFTDEQLDAALARFRAEYRANLA